MNKRYAEVALYAVALSFAIYVCSYFVLVRPGISAAVWMVSGWGCTTRGFSVSPDYRGIPSQIFQPIHYLYRLILRPKKWYGSKTTYYDWNVSSTNVAP